jgi:hypothetical protein
VNSQDDDGAVSGYANFYLSDCVTGAVDSCTLDIAITSTQVDPRAAGQLISGISFSLLNAGTSLAATGTLSDTINNNSNGNGTGGAVALDGDPDADFTTTTPDRWDLLAKQGGGFYLTTITQGQPQYMIMGAGPDPDANASIGNFSPSLMGTVDFQITDIVGLKSSTKLDSVSFYFGTGPDAHIGGVCTSGCGTISTTGAQPGPVPEPFSMVLAGSGLLALGILRRRA